MRVVPMGVARWPAEFEQRNDPKGRHYYWATGSLPTDVPHDTDMTAIREGCLTLTPLDADRTHHAQLATMRDWGLSVPVPRS
jgi:5'-nucleotidase